MQNKLEWFLRLTVKVPEGHKYSDSFFTTVFYALQRCGKSRTQLL